MREHKILKIQVSLKGGGWGWVDFRRHEDIWKSFPASKCRRLKHRRSKCRLYQNIDGRNVHSRNIDCFLSRQNVCRPLFLTEIFSARHCHIFIANVNPNLTLYPAWQNVHYSSLPLKQAAVDSKKLG